MLVLRVLRFSPILGSGNDDVDPDEFVAAPIVARVLRRTVVEGPAFGPFITPLCFTSFEVELGVRCGESSADSGLLLLQCTYLFQLKVFRVRIYRERVGIV